jgi:hypothetical protein
MDNGLYLYLGYNTYTVRCAMHFVTGRWCRQPSATIHQRVLATGTDTTRTTHKNAGALLTAITA